MKMVINQCYGGFNLSAEAKKALGVEYAFDVKRTDPHLVEMVEKDGNAVGGEYSELAVIEIPDNATDWEMDEYDGFESVIAVINGKIVHLG